MTPFILQTKNFFFNTDGNNLTNALDGALANIDISATNSNEIDDSVEPQASNEEFVPVE